MNKINKQQMSIARSVFVTLTLSAVIVITGCKEEGPAEKTGKKLDQAIEKTNERIEEKTDALKQAMEVKEEAMTRQSESVGEYIDDAAITGKMKAAMMAEPLVSAYNIEIITEKGVVKLNGIVNAQQSVDRALEIARGVPGVKSVENHLIVSAGDMR